MVVTVATPAAQAIGLPPNVVPWSPGSKMSARGVRSEEHTSELQSLTNLVCRLLLEKKKKPGEIQCVPHIVCRFLVRKKHLSISTNEPARARAGHIDQLWPSCAAASLEN